eukprot:m.67368 g.67368  ORF g.67368 m.67368 type:complete len:235 (+) comp12161_c0_seq2:148-852(+)
MRAHAKTRKAAVVLQIGREVTKAGLAGEPTPRFAISSVVKRNGKVLPVLSPDTWSDKFELHEILTDFLFEVVTKQLLLKPSERECHVVCDMYTPTHFELLVEAVLLKALMFTKVHIHHKHQVSMLTLPTPTALVVDCGVDTTTAVVQHHGGTVLPSVVLSDKGSSSVHATLLDQLQSKNQEATFTKNDLRDVMVRACFACPPPEGIVTRFFLFPFFVCFCLLVKRIVRLGYYII